MKKQFLSAGAILSLLCSLVIAGAAIDSVRLKANIPFEFTVGKTKLPAGSYTIDNSVARGCLKISAANRSKNVLVSFFGGQSSARPSQAKMVFHRYGDQYFLWQVWNEGGAEAMQLRQSRAERELARHLNHLAQNKAEPELVIVLAR